jgi:hypothetical protein
MSTAAVRVGVGTRFRYDGVGPVSVFVRRLGHVSVFVVRSGVDAT